MIPTIEEIIAGLLSGDFTKEQALAWLDQHIELAVDRFDCRSMFAAAALQGRLAAGVRPPNKASLATECFEYADAMVAGSRGAESQS